MIALINGKLMNVEIKDGKTFLVNCVKKFDRNGRFFWKRQIGKQVHGEIINPPQTSRIITVRTSSGYTNMLHKQGYRAGFVW